MSSLPLLILLGMIGGWQWVIIIALIPLSLRGVKYRELPADKQLRHNLMIYGVGGIILPFIVIKLIDMALTMCGIA